MNAEKPSSGKAPSARLGSRLTFRLSPFLTLILLTLAVSNCSSKRTDLRSLAPADTLVYLETIDLGAALQPIIDSKPFNGAAAYKPDLSALNGVQIAVCITGFELSEERLTEEHSVGKIQPRFVAIADTHAWNYQAVGFAETKLGSFVEKIYESEPTLERSEKNGGSYFAWSAKDGRKAFALVIDSLIYFGNDESTIEKCLAIRQGQADSIAKSGKVETPDAGTLAFGYVSADGVAQLANVAGLKLASDSTDDEEARSAIAGILPQLIRNSVTEIEWKSTITENGLMDTWSIAMPPEVANVLDETMAPLGGQDVPAGMNFLGDANSVTVYRFKDPRVAWRSVVLISQQLTGPLSGGIITGSSNALFEPYGIRDPETFLSSIDGPLVTANYSENGDSPVVIATVKDNKTATDALLEELTGNRTPADNSRRMSSEELGLSAVFNGAILIAGSTDGVNKSLDAEKVATGRVPIDPSDRTFDGSSVLTFTRENETAVRVVEFLNSQGTGYKPVDITSTTKTRFTRSGVERITTSDFGFIGWIIAQLTEE